MPGRAKNPTLHIMRWLYQATKRLNLHDRPFHNFISLLLKIKSKANFIVFRNDIRRILKLQSCESVGCVA